MSKRLQDRPPMPVSMIGTALSLLGIADTIYLTTAHYTSSVTLACPATAFINCQKVTTSSYSAIHGIPLAVLGLVFFGVMLVFQLPVAWALDYRLLRLARIALSLGGLLGVFWLVFVELFRLDSICLYCTAAHILIFGLFATTVVGTAITTPAQGERD